VIVTLLGEIKKKCLIGIKESGQIRRLPSAPDHLPAFQCPASPSLLSVHHDLAGSFRGVIIGAPRPVLDSPPPPTRCRLGTPTLPPRPPLEPSCVPGKGTTRGEGDVDEVEADAVKSSESSCASVSATPVVHSE